MLEEVSCEKRLRRSRNRLNGNVWFPRSRLNGNEDLAGKGPITPLPVVHLDPASLLLSSSRLNAHTLLFADAFYDDRFAAGGCKRFDCDGVPCLLGVLAESPIMASGGD